MKTIICLLAFNAIWGIAAQDICSLPSETGLCLAAFKKWYYNSADMECQQFVYGGCGGNANNFETKQECEKECADVCSRPAFTGPCKARKRRWYYNSAAKECQEFFYGGCQSNGNNFMTKEECDQKCTDIDICSLPISRGMCFITVVRWGFETSSQKCISFLFSGCDGNANNFETERECLNACDKTGCVHVDCTTTHCPAGIKMVKGCNNKQCQCNCPCKNMKCTDPQHECVLRENHKCKGKSCPLEAECDFKLCLIGELSQHNPGCSFGSSKCPTGFTCKEHPLDSPVGCCPNDVCHANPNSGCGKKQKMRWYYDYKKKDCFKFRYGGKGGNGNNFSTKAACLGKCA